MSPIYATKYVRKFNIKLLNFLKDFFQFNNEPKAKKYCNQTQVVIMLENIVLTRSNVCLAPRLGKNSCRLNNYKNYTTKLNLR